MENRLTDFIGKTNPLPIYINTDNSQDKDDYTMIVEKLMYH